MLVSGTGTLLQTLIAASQQPDYPVRIAAVGVDRKCPATDHAEAAGIPHFRVSLREYADRGAWDTALTEAVAAYAPGLVVTAGFMKILGPAFLESFGGRVINTHPALLPSFPGAHGVVDALDYGVRVTGATVHLADAGVDAGPILAQEPVLVAPGDTVEGLHERIKVVERRLLTEVVAAVALRGVVSDGRRAAIGPDAGAR